jgi:hypothetical protein
MAEIYIPITNPRFVHDKLRKEGWLEFELEKEHSNKTTLNRLVGYGIDKKYYVDEYYTLRRNKTFHWDAPRNNPTAASHTNLTNYYFKIRKELKYIYPFDTWYVKRKDIHTGIIDKGTLTLTYAAMHRLSELSRYDPQRLKKHLESTSGWLLSEFIDKSSSQFVEQISSEITGDDFRPTGFR